VSGERARPPRFPLPLSQVAPAARPAEREPFRPQRPLREAAAEAHRRAPPSGQGLDSHTVRARMVERLRAGGVTDENVLAAFGAVPRHLFVDGALVVQAYEDTSLPIGLEQTISKPSVVARMLALLLARAPAPLTRVLEIGTGCGYQAALLSCIARSVVSIERLRPLHDKARRNLDLAGVRNVRLVYGDGRAGHAPNAPYDAIVAAAGGDELPAAWLDQLAVGGRLVAPVHSDAHRGQVLVVVDRDGAGYRRQAHDAVHFVPLESGVD
jgi:protein-L-isoaspartate(D-aspartate) O-methyltransferase